MKATLPSTASTNLTVINGTATNTVSGSTLSFTASDRTVLSWTNFWDGTGAGGTSAVGDVISYTLPSATAAVLNQVTGGVATTINGTISSNGKVFVVNAAGVTIGATGVINTAAFGASTTAEPLNYFEQNDTLAVFGNGLSTSGSNAISVNSGASITTIGGSGNVYLAGGTVNLSASITGNALIYSGSGGVFINGATISSTPASGGSVGGALTIVDQGGTVDLSNGTGSTIQGNLTVSSNGGLINLTNGGNVTVTGNTVIDASSGSGANGNVAQGAGTFFASTASTTTLINTATETTAGVASTGNPGTLATPATFAPGTVTLTSADFAGLSVISGNFSIVDPTSNNLALGTANVVGTYSANSTLGNITSSGAVAVTGGISLTTAAANKTITFVGTGAETFSTLSTNATGGAATLTSSGTISLPATAVPTLTVTSTAGAINETGIISSATGKFSASTGINLDTQSNTLGKVTLIGGSAGTFLVNNSALTILTGTATTGKTVLETNGTLTFGTAAGDSISFGGSLGIDVSSLGAGSSVATTAGTLVVNGAVGISGLLATSNVVLGATGNTTSSFGQISVSGINNLTINEGGGSTNLGGTYTFSGSTTASGAVAAATIIGNPAGTLATLTGDTVAGNLVVVTGGSILNPSKIVSVAGTSTLTAGTTSAPGSIQLGTNTAGNIAALTGTVTDNVSSSLTLVNSAPTTIVATTASGALSVIQTGAGGLTATFTGTTGSFSSESFTMNGGSVSITGNNSATTITNATTTNVAGTVNLTGNGTITLGTGINLLNTGATTITTSGTGSNIVDTAGSSFSIYGPATFSSSGSILLNNGTANSVGAVTLALTSTTANSSIAYTEGQTVNLAGITVTNLADTGSIAITANGGDILQSGAAINTGLTTALSGVTFSAVNGAVNLSTFTNTIGALATTTPISILAKNASSLTDASSIALGNSTVSAAGLALSETAATGTITQATGTSAFVYGATGLTSAGGAISLTNSGNNFGQITVATAGGAASIHETYTSNYAGVSTGAGSFTSLVDSGNIIETAGATIAVTGKSTLTSTTGAITLTNATNTFTGGLLVTTGGNASITDQAATTTLIDGTKITGNLALTNSAAAGKITDSGSSATISVTGTASLIANGGGASSIVLTGTNSSYGPVLFKAGTGASSFTENASTVLLGGSLVSGSMVITSGGNITTSGAQQSSYSSTLRLNALGSIVLNTPINVTNGLTVDAAAGPTNLSVESLATNLNGIAVVNLGNTTNYTGPSTP